SVQGTAAQIVSAVSESSLLLTVADFDVTSVSAANITLAVADAALTQVSDQRARFGALQSRFESTIRNLDTTVENLSGARSRIMDADFAIETAELTRTQILQQAGTAMLAQANTIPQNVLTLLQ
ncbi:MAG: flagellin, partial [Gammaproteobacteria bacterium]|nr:flagellin [Gammaproteobacteria bacterium]